MSKKGFYCDRCGINLISVSTSDVIMKEGTPQHKGCGGTFLYKKKECKLVILLKSYFSGETTGTLPEILELIKMDEELVLPIFKAVDGQPIERNPGIKYEDSNPEE